MTEKPSPNVIDVLKNILLACEANGLRDLPFVRDARWFIEQPSGSGVQLFSEAADEVGERNGPSGHAPETDTEPLVSFDWKEVAPGKWRADVAPGWHASVNRSTGDTWSFFINGSGRSYLATREEAVGQAEVWMRSRIAEAVENARQVLAAFSVSTRPYSPAEVSEVGKSCAPETSTAIFVCSFRHA